MAQEKDYDYTVDTKIHLMLNIGLVNCRQEDFIPLGDLIDRSQDELDAMSKESVDELIRKALDEWIWEYIDYGWDVKEE